MNNKMKGRILIDFSTIDPNFTFTLGKVSFAKAENPLEKHIHKGSMEIVYNIKGEQIYNVEGKDYVVRSGDIFMTFPDELHSTGYYPVDKSMLYYLIIDLNRMHSLIGYSKKEENHLIRSLIHADKRLFKGTDQLAELLSNLVEVYDSPSPYKKTLVRNYLSQFLIALVQCMTKELQNDLCNMSYILQYIDENINSDVTISKLAEIANLSETRFKLNFRKQIGIPPHEYILRKKVDAAKNLLLTSPNLTITEIAFKLSFSSSQYFSTVFKRFTTISPSQYKTWNKD